MPVTCTNYKLKCGGCPLLNQPYPDQLKHKQQLEQRLLGRFAPVSPVLGQAEPWHYRNKAIATFATGPRGRLTCGIYAAGTHRVLPYTDCLLQDTVINQTIAAVLEAARACRWPAFEEDRGTGLLRHVLVRRGKTSGQVLVVLVTAQENLPGSRNFVKALREKAPWVTSVVQNCNPRRTSAVLGSDVRTLYGPGKITDTLCGLQFAISPRSFYQVNPEQTEVLYAKAIEFAALTGKETVIDAYWRALAPSAYARRAGQSRSLAWSATRTRCAMPAPTPQPIRSTTRGSSVPMQPIGCALRHSPTLACRTPMLYSWTLRGRAAPPPALMQWLP